MPVRVWGTADCGETVTVAFAGQTRTADPDAAGKWQVTLDPLKANATPAEMTIRGKNQIVIKDVLVGEVWLASGQSNMTFRFQPSFYPDEACGCESADPHREYRGCRVDGSARHGATQLERLHSANDRRAIFRRRIFLRQSSEQRVARSGGHHPQFVGGKRLAEPWIDRDALLANPSLRNRLSSRSTI